MNDKRVDQVRKDNTQKDIPYTAALGSLMPLIQSEADTDITVQYPTHIIPVICS